MDFVSGKGPPKIAGDVSIARFPCQDTGEKWRVCVGHNHFLTDRRTAHRMLALADDGQPERTYRDVYVACRASECDPGTIENFVEWCEAHRERLEALAGAKDTHALRYRRILLPARTCQMLAARLRWLFQPPVFVALWGAALLLIGLHWFERMPSRESGNFLLAALIALLGIFLHELGHITACVRYGARQGGIGVGLYWIWPAFYADVRDGWSLRHVQRAAVSVGGLYFQSLYLALLCAFEAVEPHATLSIAIGMTLLLMLTTLNPVFKYDGYWILSDLLNLTNLHARIGQHLRGITKSTGSSRRRLLCGRMTVLSLGFVLMATGYIGYLLDMMVGTVAVQISGLPALWVTTARLLGEHRPLLGEAGISVARFCMALLGVTFLGMAIAVLGWRSLQSAIKVVRRA